MKDFEHEPGEQTRSRSVMSARRGEDENEGTKERTRKEERREKRESRRPAEITRNHKPVPQLPPPLNPHLKAPGLDATLSPSYSSSTRPARTPNTVILTLPVDPSRWARRPREKLVRLERDSVEELE